MVLTHDHAVTAGFELHMSGVTGRGPPSLGIVGLRSSHRAVSVADRSLVSFLFSFSLLNGLLLA